MPNVVVGSMTVDLVSRTASFQNDMGKAAQSAKSAFASMKQDAQSSSTGMSGGLVDVRHNLGLLDNTIRGAHAQAMADLVRMFAQSSVVMTALPIAGTIAGLVLVGGIIYDLANKVEAQNQKLDASAKAWQKVNDDGLMAVRTLDEQLGEAAAKVDDLNGNHLAALQIRLGLINEQKFDKLISAIKSISTEADAAFAKMQVGSLSSFFGNGNDSAVAQAQSDFAKVVDQVTSMAKKGMGSSIGFTLDQAIKDFQSEAAGGLTFNNESESQAKTREQVYAQIVTMLQNVKDQYVDLNKLAADNGAITVKSFDDGEKSAAKFLATLTSEVGKLKNDRLPGTLPAQQIDPGIFGLGGITKGITGAMPLYGGSPIDMLNTQIAKGGQSAIDATNKVRDAIETVNQKLLAEQSTLQTLNDLYHSTSGLMGISDAEFAKAMKSAKDDALGISADWKKLGEDIGQTVQQAILMKSGWHDALSAIAVDIGLAIAKMEVLNALAASNIDSKSGGVGGFLFSLFGGITKHATGGTIPAGGFGIAGENGPEMIYGGTSGMTVFPMPPARSSNGPNVTVIYQTDARGADPSILSRLPMALQQTKDQAVREAVQTVSEWNKRR